ncbi:MAG: LacI family DNA-binding transcriptional regulator [Bryobacterales bacterium]|nr:LacI family DNA-binding transcriptional regulator [Bryobacterales bacterium]
MAVTLKDVAREAGVDLSTVSRSLSGSYGVHEETRKRVLEVAERLHYRPNRIARGLVTGRSHTLGLIVSDVRNPFFAEVARGAEDAACAHGCDLVLCNSDLDQAKQMRYIVSLAEKRVDGILMNSVSALGKAQQQALAGFGMPIVLLNRASGAHSFSTVCADNYLGGQLAGRYLKAKGHIRIAHLTGPRGHGNLSDRARGFLNAVPDAVVLHGRHTFQGGCELAGKLLERHPEVTAVFAANDVMAFGVMRAAAERGLRVPQDLSVVGFDNIEFSGIAHPPLTTVHQPKYEIGAAAVEILLRLAEKQNGSAPERRIFGVELIERDSVQDCRTR